MTLSFQLARFGTCLCGVNLALHRDDRNRSIGCEAARRRLEDQALQTRRQSTQQSLRALHIVRRARNLNHQGGIA